MTALDQPAPKNHNNPPSDIELLEDNLTLRYIDLIRNGDEYVEEAKNIPKELTEQMEADYLSDRVNEIQLIRKTLEAARKEEKEPFLRSGKFVDKFFNDEIDRLDAAALAMTRPLHVWLQKMAVTEKNKREAEAIQLGLEAAAAIKDVQDTPTKENLDRAVAFHQVTTIAERIAAAPIESLAKAEGKFSRAIMKKVWIGTIIDISSIELEKLRPYLTLSVLQVALNAYVKAGGRHCAGCKISEEHKTTVK